MRPIRLSVGMMALAGRFLTVWANESNRLGLILFECKASIHRASARLHLVILSFFGYFFRSPRVEGSFTLHPVSTTPICGLVAYARDWGLDAAIPVHAGAGANPPSVA